MWFVGQKKPPSHVIAFPNPLDHSLDCLLALSSISGFGSRGVVAVIGAHNPDDGFVPAARCFQKVALLFKTSNRLIRGPANNQHGNEDFTEV